MDILLSVIPPWDYEKPPLGAASLATYLKSIGIAVEVMDINIELYRSSPEVIRKNWINQASFFWRQDNFTDNYNLAIDNFANKILSSNSKILGFSVNTSSSIYFLEELISKIRKEDFNKPIIVGGPGCFFPHDRKIFKDNSVNFFVIGKGEFALEGLLAKIGAINNYEALQKCSIYKDQNGHSCVTGAQDYSLDRLPFPTFDEFNLNLYSSQIMPIFSSEGCINNCIFCLDRIFHKRHRSKNASRVIDEIKFYIERYGVRHFCFVDNLINANLKFLDEFCDYIIKENILIEWSGQFIVRGSMNKSFFEKLKMAGCNRLDFGIESFSDNVLKILRKGFFAKEAIQNIIDAKTAGLKVSIFIIIGSPGEEEKDFAETLMSISRYSKYIDAIGNLTLCSIPWGTDLYNNPQNYNIEVEGLRTLKEFWLKWHTKDNANNFEIRLDRLERLKNLLRELKIPFQDNLKIHDN